ncbi:uncharacterized protein LOC121975569 [Zingiber officinale]|uniref:uncharacterized protein LOC121975569 n=1 Tax=Zingiber officinale TaxID=94328 RepID=UPI001C4C3055|nr:uncharacterized protein LOC121975569 [Zingiber officinale]
MRFLVSDFLLPSTFIVRPGLGFSDCGEMGQQSLTYSFVARGTAFLAEHTEVAGNFNSITASRGSSPATKSFPHRGRIRDTYMEVIVSSNKNKNKKARCKFDHVQASCC